MESSSSEDKAWVLFVFPGVGDIAAWVDPELINDDATFLEADHLTKMIPHPSGNSVGLAKMMDKATINIRQAMVITRPPAEIVSELSRAWDTPGKILLSHKRFTLEK